MDCSLAGSYRPSMGVPKQEYWRGLAFPPPGDLSNPGTKPMALLSPALQADSVPLCHQGSPMIGIVYETQRAQPIFESQSGLSPFHC